MPAQQPYYPPSDITGPQYPDSLYRRSQHHQDGVYNQDADYWWHYFKSKNQEHTCSDESVEYSDPDEGSKDCECNCQKCTVEHDPCCQTTCQSCGFPPNSDVIVVPYPYPIIMSAQPEKTKEKPSKTTAHSEKTKLKLSKTTENPPKTTKNSPKTTAKPRKRTKNSPKTTAKLPKTTAMPPKTTLKVQKPQEKSLKRVIMAHTTIPCKTTPPRSINIFRSQFTSNANGKFLEQTTSLYDFSPSITRLRQNNIYEFANPEQLKDKKSNTNRDIIFKTPRKGKSDGKYVVSSLKSIKQGWIPKYGIVPIPGDMAKKLLNQLQSVKALKKETHKYNPMEKYMYERILRDALKYYSEKDLDAHNPLKRYVKVSSDSLPDIVH